MSNIGEVTSLNKLNTSDNATVNPPRTPQFGGIKSLIQHSNVLGNVILASENKSVEPLPFSNYSLFDETYDHNQLKIHVNPFSASKDKVVFLPKTPIKVSVTAERKHGAHIFHPYLYTLSFEHGKFKWDVQRSYKDLKDVHKTLAKLVKADIGRSCSDISQADIKPEWPKFPTDHDHLINSSKIGERCQLLKDYLEKLLTYPPFRDHQSVLNLLNVSPISFITELGPSILEGSLQKRTGDNVYYGRLSQLKICCEKAKIFHTKRWFVLKDSYIVYLNEERNSLVGYVMLVDRTFNCKMKHRAGAYHAIIVKNLQRTLVLKLKNAQSQKEWYEKIIYMIQETGKPFYDNNFLKYDSYAPYRPNQMCKWYINAAQYMEHVMHALNGAREEIYITDWWMCPELYLKRPTDDLQYRLDKILLKKAKEGVKVYVLLFKEVTLAISLLSSRTKNVLTQNGKNPNIKVLRHPEHSPAGVMLWSHHEKCVIIDQSIAFMGGIDLCFGRWDDDLHRLVDLGRKVNETQVIDTRADSLNKPSVKMIDDRDNKSNASIDKENNVDREDEKSLEEKAQINTPEIDSKNLLQQPTPPLLKTESSERKAADSLIVAALMGNSIMRFKAAGANAKRMNYQMSVPVEMLTSTKSSFNETTERMKSLNENEILKTEQICLEELNVKQPDSNSETKNKLKQILINKINSANKSNTSNNKTNQNISNLSNTTRSANSSKASKYLSLPTIDPNESGATDLSKKERVKKKWDKFKKNVKKRSHHNPLNKLRRRSSRSGSDSDATEEYDSVEEEEIAELPIISQEGHYWIGKDYSNTYKADFKDVADFSRDQFNREETPRMPWRDEALAIYGESARDLARHFIQRWNQCKREKVKQIESYPFLLPKAYNEPFSIDYKSLIADSSFKCNVQITRSLDSWSGGLSETETSILKAYRDLIQKAEHYINQFFVTTTDPEKDNEVKNDIGLQLVNRILKAHEKKEKFRVYIVLPLLPGFDSLNAIQAVQYYNLRSINLGDYSIFKSLKKAGITDPSEYITFHGMRNWAVLMGKLVQEIVYVHSKLMIVDDKYVICGSANINDRSLLGKRDSEIAAVIRDEEFQDSVLNGKKVKVGKYAYSLRRKIFRLHLGIYFDNPKQIDVKDCVSDEFYNLFKSTSNQNTKVYDEVFKCLPSDNILNFEILATYRDQSCLVKNDPVKGKAEIEEKVSGFLVDFPLKFLSQEKNFFPEINTPEGIVPTQMWT